MNVHIEQKKSIVVVNGIFRQGIIHGIVQEIQCYNEQDVQISND